MQGKRDGMFGVSIDDEGVKAFEEDQKQHGTQVALFNFVFCIVDATLKNLGVGKFSTSKVTRNNKPVSKLRKK